MVDPQIIDEWLDKAENDFEFAQIVFSEDKARQAQSAAARVRDMVRAKLSA